MLPIVPRALQGSAQRGAARRGVGCGAVQCGAVGRGRIHCESRSLSCVLAGARAQRSPRGFIALFHFFLPESVPNSSRTSCVGITGDA
jgi:hypothetical protein